MFLLVFQQLTDKMSPHSPTHLDCRSACSVRVCVTTLKEQRNVQQQETQAALTLALNIFLIKLRRFLFQTTETRRRILLLWFPLFSPGRSRGGGLNAPLLLRFLFVASQRSVSGNC